MSVTQDTNEQPSNHFVIGRRQLYILPTKIGWYFSLILIALFAIAVKFDNQAAFMMLFILIGLGNAIMLGTHRNLINVSLDKGIPSSAYAGQHATLGVTLNNTNDRARRAIYVSYGDLAYLANIEPQSRKQIQLEYPTPTRGLHPFPPIILSSQYPTGLFFCWSKKADIEELITVYPEPKDLVNAFSSSESGDIDDTLGSQTQQQGDFQGLRSYQEGDRLRDVHWPSYAKHQKLISKEYEQPGTTTSIFDWNDLPKSMSEEDKLSQLCFWLKTAEQSGDRYGLNMPSTMKPLDSGPQHLHECLSILAAYETTETSIDQQGETGSMSFLTRLRRFLSRTKGTSQVSTNATRADLTNAKGVGRR